MYKLPMSFVQMFCLYLVGVYLLTVHVLLHYSTTSPCLLRSRLSDVKSRVVHEELGALHQPLKLSVIKIQGVPKVIVQRFGLIARPVII